MFQVILVANLVCVLGASVLTVLEFLDLTGSIAVRGARKKLTSGRWTGDLNKKPRMHSSRIHTVRCSGRLSCHAHPLAMHTPSCHAHPPPAMHAPAIHAPTMHAPCHTHPPAMHAPHHAHPLPCTPPPVDRIFDTRLWKHYLSATTVADDNNTFIWKYLSQSKS